MTKTNEPAPISWEEARVAVWRKNRQAFAAWENDGDFTSVCIMSKPHGEVISEWFNGPILQSRELQEKAWLSAHSRLGGAEQPLGLTVGDGCKWCAEGFKAVQSSVSEQLVHPDSPVGRVLCCAHRESFFRYVNAMVDLENTAPAVPAPPVLSPSLLFATNLHRPNKRPVPVLHTTSSAADEYAKFWTSPPHGFPDARVEMFRGDELVAEYHSLFQPLPTPPAEGSAEGDFPPRREDHVYEPCPNNSVGCSCGWSWDGHDNTPDADFVQAWGNHRAELASQTAKHASAYEAIVKTKNLLEIHEDDAETMVEGARPTILVDAEEAQDLLDFIRSVITKSSHPAQSKPVAAEGSLPPLDENPRLTAFREYRESKSDSRISIDLPVFDEEFNRRILYISSNRGGTIPPETVMHEQLSCRERQLRAALAALESREEWTSCAERMPTSGEDKYGVLTVNNFGTRQLGHYDSEKGWYASGTGRSVREENEIWSALRLTPNVITHWRPLPAPPSTPSTEESDATK